MPKPTRKATSRRKPATAILRRRPNELQAVVDGLARADNVEHPEHFADIEAKQARTAAQVEAFGRRLVELVKKVSDAEANARMWNIGRRPHEKASVNVKKWRRGLRRRMDK